MIIIFKTPYPNKNDSEKFRLFIITIQNKERQYGK